MNSNTNLGELIKNQLYLCGKTQTWLAAQCQVTNGQISHLISGRCNPSLKLVKSISMALSIDPIILLEATFKQ